MRWLYWIREGRLGGMTRPGRDASLEEQIRSLCRHGVRHLICLEEKIAYDASLFARQGICVTHEPIPDMRAPRIERARRWCQLTSEAWAKGEGVVFHCFAGLGRTGTAIASCLIFWGASAESALRRVRTVEPRAVHTAEQESFLVLFEGWLRDQEEPMPRQAR